MCSTRLIGTVILRSLSTGTALSCYLSWPVSSRSTSNCINSIVLYMFYNASNPWALVPIDLHCLLPLILNASSLILVAPQCLILHRKYFFSLILQSQSLFCNCLSLFASVKGSIKLNSKQRSICFQLWNWQILPQYLSSQHVLADIHNGKPGKNNWLSEKTKLRLHYI